MRSIEVARAAETIYITSRNMGLANEWLRWVAGLDTPDITGRMLTGKIGKFGTQSLQVISNKDMPNMVNRFKGFGLWGSDQALEDRTDECTWEDLGLSVGVRFALLGPEGYDLDADRTVSVATSYPRSLGRYLGMSSTINDEKVEVLEVTGGTEGYPANGSTEAAYDLVGTGRSARANGLKVIEFSDEEVTLGGLYWERQNARW